MSSMNGTNHPALGLIEGFFGPPWPEQDRLGFAPFLQKHDFAFYLYAPKADPFLRKKWREPWSAEYKAKLKNYSRHFRAHQVQFGVGLSPFELHLQSPQEQKRLLREKLQQLEEAGLDVLGLFFDDMPVHEGLAQAQLEAIEIVRSCTKARIIFCPAFYTPDPILEKVFGKRPATYWDEIKTAPKEIDFAWTGPKVISEDMPVDHLKETTALLGRKPFLWDNLYANDGPRNCKFLKIRPPVGRTRAALEESNGWAWNPMNQAALSQLVMLAARQAVLDRTAPDFALAHAIQSFCPPELAAFVMEHKKEMLELGLDKLEAATKDEWRGKLKDWQHPVAKEIDQWLAGEFVVGAECLTD
jgi:hyaluronoglucosaminidase